MGWAFMHREKGVSARDFFTEEFCASDPSRIVDIAQVGFSEAYIAYRTDQGHVVGVVVLTKWVPADWHNFGYKPMDETMGPGYHRCPKRIFDLLTPLGDMYTPTELAQENHSAASARQWREAVQARLDRPHPQKGDTVRFARAFSFTNGDEADTFTYEGRNVFRALGVRYRIRGWKECTYEITDSAQKAA